MYTRGEDRGQRTAAPGERGLSLQVLKEGGREDGRSEGRGRGIAQRRFPLQPRAPRRVVPGANGMLQADRLLDNQAFFLINVSAFIF